MKSKSKPNNLFFFFKILPPSFQDKVNGLTDSIKDVEAKISDYSVCIVPTTTSSSSAAAGSKLVNGIADPISDELREIERELGRILQTVKSSSNVTVNLEDARRLIFLRHTYSVSSRFMLFSKYAELTAASLEALLSYYYISRIFFNSGFF